MMIDLFELNQSLGSLVNTFQGGWFRPQTDFQRACNDISNELWNEQTNKAEKSEEVKANLIYFLKSENIIVAKEKSAYGRLEVPADYGRRSSLRLITDGVKCYKMDEISTDDEKMIEEYYDNLKEINIPVVDNAKWGSANKHLTKSPTLTNPLATQIGQESGKEIKGGFKISPRDISVVVLDYYVRPRDAVFAYTTTPGNVQTGAGDQIVYDKARSFPLQWPTTMVNEFLIRLGSRYGAFTRDQFMAQYSEQQKK